MIRSCYFMSRVSATMVLVSPDPRSLVVVVNIWAKSISSSFMAEQGRGDCSHEQDCPASRFQVILANPQ